MIPTAEELYRDTKINSNLDLFSDDVPHLVKLMIEFARLHVDAARKEFKMVFSEIDDVYPFMKDDKLSDIYPLTNIK